MKVSSEKKGFSVLVVTFIIVVVGLIGFGGWYVLEQKDKNQDKRDESSSLSSSNTQNQVLDPTENGKYLVIKEWGVRLPLPRSLHNDVIYGVSEIKEPEDTQDPLIVYITSKKLTAFSKLCGLGSRDDEYAVGADGGRVALTRYKEQTPSNGMILEVSDGTYWYQSEKSGASCALDNQEVQNYESYFLTELRGSEFYSKPEKY